MSIALKVAALFTGFVAFSGFIFGQAFAGSFSWVASWVGVCGLATAVGAFKLAAGPGQAPAWIIWVSALALLGLGADVINYYGRLIRPGSYYAWELMVPFAACIAFVGLTALRGSNTSQG